jgi:hypothetical protein
MEILRGFPWRLQMDDFDTDGEYENIGSVFI